MQIQNVFGYNIKCQKSIDIITSTHLTVSETGVIYTRALSTIRSKSKVFIYK